MTVTTPEAPPAAPSPAESVQAPPAPARGAGRELSALAAVPPPRATRKLAIALMAILALLPILLLFVPWQQNVSGVGRVTAFEPLDRTQVIPAPVTGRLVELLVQEGEFVEQGQRLAEMADQDPLYSSRLEQLLSFADNKVEAQKQAVARYDDQLVRLEDAREQAVTEANAELAAAIKKVSEQQQGLYAAEAEREQKFADRERKWKLFQEGIASELDFQKAEADFKAADAKVEAAKAKVDQARSEEEAKIAKVGKVSSDQLAKIEKARSEREEARSKLALAEKERTEATTAIARQSTQTIHAPRSGYVLRVHAANSADLLSQGEPLIEIIPQTEQLAAELWVRGIDAPLITPGRKVRLQFEGWPAVQFAGWPSVAVGTFGGVVSVVDAHGTPEGRFRTLVEPDPDDEPWPDQRYLRQGARASGWVLLDEVSLGYEIWRQLNAFPPSVSSAPDAVAGAALDDAPKTRKPLKSGSGDRGGK